MLAKDWPDSHREESGGEEQRRGDTGWGTVPRWRQETKKKKEGLGLPGDGTYAGPKDILVWPGTNSYYHASVFSPENRVQCSRDSGEH